ncbi:protein kinase [Planomonospora sp. ID67723]|uniref:protein kinase domain-containing protein n=1 Tax=Planomonospora sp. ID67723 TaxID=2738134 RepID=UPI0018C3C0C8|nr:protein kinase [Planomonospora sp. ID67723]MBG0827285.1 protein kinase [Planomonospora sp. ID67723]
MPETQPLRQGDPQVLGAYRLVGRLGEGAQGIVYAGRAPDGTMVAIKLLHPRLSNTGIDGDRFLREVAAARRVAQFCTAQVIGAHMEDDSPYIVSELVEGVSLQKVVQTEGPRTGNALYRLAVGTVTALAAIHRAGIVHRDFKPSNVLLGSDGPRVIDFGIARALDSALTMTSGVVGTPAYMSPEQVAGQRVEPSSDMFSWGLTMAFAATGRPAFGQDSLPAVIYRVMNEEPDLSALPDNLRPVVTACLNKRAEERPSASEVLFTLLGSQAEEEADAEHGEADLDRSLDAGSRAAAGSPPAPGSGPGSALPPVPSPAPPHGEPPVEETRWVRPSGVDPVSAFDSGGDRSAPPAGVPFASPSAYPANAPAGPPPGAFRPPAPGILPGAVPEAPGEGRSRRARALLVIGVLAGALVLAAGVLVAVPNALDRPGDPVPGQSALAGSPAQQQVPVQTSQATPTPAPVRASTPPPEQTPAPPRPPATVTFDGQDGKALKGHGKAVQSLADAKIGDRRVVVSGGQDGTLRIWDPAKHKTLHRLRGHRGEIYAVATVTVGGTPYAVTGGYDHTVRLWNLKTRKGKRLGYHPIAVFAVAAGQVNGAPVAVTGDGDGVLQIWNLKSRRQIKTIQAHRNDVNWLAFGKVGDRTVVVSASADESLKVWDLTRKKQYGKAYRGHGKAVFSVAVGTVGDRPVVASGGKDKQIRIWDPKTAKTIGKPLKGHKGNVYSLAFGEVDGRTVLVSGSTDGTVRLWDPAAREPLGKAVKAHKGGVYSVDVVTVDGRPAVVSAGKDRTVKIWRLAPN